MFLTVIASLALAVGEASTSTGLAATPAEAAMKVERLKQEIAQEEKAWAEELVREKEAEARRKQRFADFTQDRNRLQQSLAEQEEKLKAFLAKMESHQYREKELKARFLSLNSVLAAQAKILKEDLAKGMPYQMDKRSGTPALLIRDVESGNISPEEGMNRLWAFHQNERRLAQESEVFSGDLAQGGGDPIQVKYLRIGKQAMAYTSLDGTKLGILKAIPGEAGPEYAWVTEQDMDHETKQAVKTAIATKEGTSVPGFVPLPLWNSSFASAGAVGSADGKGAGSAGSVPAAGVPSSGKAGKPAAAKAAPAGRAAP